MSIQNLHMEVQSSFIHSPKLKATKILSMDEWIHKLVFHISFVQWNSIQYSVIKRNDLSNHEKTCRNVKFIVPSERKQSENVTRYMIPTIEHSGKSKNSKKISSWQGFLEGERMNGQSTEGLQAVTLFSMVLLWWIHVIIHLSKPQEGTTQRVSQNVNYGLQLIVRH